jgi:hypothetical protein
MNTPLLKGKQCLLASLPTLLRSLRPSLQRRCAATAMQSAEMQGSIYLRSGKLQGGIYETEKR